MTARERGPRTAPQRTSRRRSLQARRAQVIDAAIREFAATGYVATRTADIARRAGVSQPYLYALFLDKRALFLACNQRATAQISQTLREAAIQAGKDADDETLRIRIGRAAIALSERHPQYRRFQFQARAAAAGDPVIRAAVRDNFIAIVDESVALHRGASRQEVLGHVAWAMLHDVTSALDLSDEYRPKL